jgi:TIR domain
MELAASFVFVPSGAGEVGDRMSRRAPEESTRGAARHAFISYVREDADKVNDLQRCLEAVGIPVWRDTASLWPGEDWKYKIRQAIQDDALVVIICFSKQALARDRSYQYDEVLLAIDELRRRRPGDPWLIPVRFDECEIPDYDIGGSRKLTDLQRADLFGAEQKKNTDRLTESALRLFKRTATSASMVDSDLITKHSTRLGKGIRFHDTHSALSEQAHSDIEPLAHLDLDAIIVPGSRPAGSLDHAITLARAGNCWLLILCSQQLHGRDVKEFLTQRSFRKAIVIDLPPGYSHELLDFPSLRTAEQGLPSACQFYTTDVSLKRNMGLILAKMLGWQRVFFLDDEIRDIAYPDLQATVDMLGSYSAVGMRVTDFPDNSIVCHANRATAGPQDVFVSGAALAVDCGTNMGFFPDVYNEDWLFFFDDVSNGRLASSHASATQLAYYPFADPRRAAWQEFGDVLAEGLYSLLHLGRNVQHATPGYWAHFLEARRSFLEAILARSLKADPDIRDELVKSVESALRCLGQINPEVCARYVQAWRADLRLWKRRVAYLSAMLSIEDALSRLGLAATTPAMGRALPAWDDTAQTILAGPAEIPRIDTLREMKGYAAS